MSHRKRDGQSTGHSGGLRPPTPLARGPPAAAAFRTEAFPGRRFDPAALIAPWRVNVVNKDPKDDLLGTLRGVLEAHPGADVCVHYSLKNNYAGSPAAAASRLATFLPAAAAAGARSVLLVSGGGARRAFDALAALRWLSKTVPDAAGGGGGSSQPARAARQAAVTAAASNGAVASNSSSGGSNAAAPGTTAAGGKWPPLYVAFNPYLPDAAAAADEAQRLRDKVATGLVAGVYLQMGDDTGRLEAGLELLAELRGGSAGPAGTGTAARQTTQPQENIKQQQQQQEEEGEEDEEDWNGASLPVFGSVFLPTPSFLACMRFRPWAGVHLSEAYLRDVAGAEAATRRLLKTYAARGVVPIVEAEIRRPEEASWIYSMLSEAYGTKGLEQIATVAAAAAAAGKSPQATSAGARRPAAAGAASPAPGPKRRRSAKG